MDSSRVVVVSGLCATGKGSISSRIAQHLRFPLFSRDAFKEAMFDKLPPCHLELSTATDDVSVEIMRLILQQLLIAGLPVVIETDTHPDNDPGPLLELLGCRCVQVFCHARPDVLLRRFKARMASPDRHPLHNDCAGLDDFAASLEVDPVGRPFDRCGPVVRVDTSDFGLINMAVIYRQVRGALGLSASAAPFRM